MKPQTRAMLWLGIACLALVGHGAHANDAPQQDAGRSRGSEQHQSSVSYDGIHRATLQDGDLKVTFSRAPSAGGALMMPIVTGRYRNKTVFSFRMDNVGRDEPTADARVIRLDPRASRSQIVVTAFTGGAHCCTDTRIVTLDAGGTWRVVDLGELDGDEGYQFTDLDGDGASELVSYDNSFLYAYDSYASSYAPTVIQKFVGGKLVDVTHDRKFHGFLRERLRQMEQDADSDTWHSNGFLGGWVAAKSLVGETDDAWPRMLQSYDRKSDWKLEEECLVPAKPGKCPDDKKRQPSFPEALLKHLAANGYPLPSHPDLAK
jgi:hypothetical protein